MVASSHENKLLTMNFILTMSCEVLLKCISLYIAIIVFVVHLLNMVVFIYLSTNLNKCHLCQDAMNELLNMLGLWPTGPCKVSGAILTVV